MSQIELIAADPIAERGLEHSAAPPRLTILRCNECDEAYWWFEFFRKHTNIARGACSDCYRKNPWGIRFMTMFDMSADSHLFKTREELEDDGFVLKGNIFEKEVGDG